MSKDLTSIKKKFASLLAINVKEAGPEGLMLLGIAALMQELPPDILGDVAEFHDKFEADRYRGKPITLPPEHYYRPGFMKEELREYNEALEAGDIVKQFDALLDIIYVAIGTIELQNFPFKQGWDEVHKSNMTKTVLALGMGKNGRRVGKGKNYVPPNLKPIIEDASMAHEPEPVFCQQCGLHHEGTCPELNLDQLTQS